MTAHTALRVAAEILVGLALGSLPFLQYGARPHHHATTVAPAHHH